jgi:large subunit ribosomal protein L24
MKTAAQTRPPKPRFKKGDSVYVIAGKSKGQSGEVLKVDLKRSLVLVKGVNLLKRHTKPRRQGEQGGIIPMEGPIHVSNVLPLDPATGKGVRKLKTAAAGG